MTMNAVSTPSGSDTIDTNAERRWKRNTMQISATTTNCSMSVSLTVQTARSMSPERS